MSFTNAQLATKIADLILYWSSFNTEYSNWVGGAVDGGPNSDGDYPLTNWAGEETLLACPAQLADNVTGYVATVAASATAASASETAAAASETAAAASEVVAIAQAVLADADRIAAELAETGAVDAKVTAIAKAAAAVVSAAAALASENAAADSETAAADSETAAAASATAAATFDPATFYTRTVLNAGQLDTRYYTETEVDNLLDDYTLTSGLSIANWNTAYGWGDHASEGYADGTNEANWDTAYGWGDHSVENYAYTTGDTFTGDMLFNGGFTVDSSGTEALSITRSGSADLTVGGTGSGDLVLSHSGAGTILIDGIDFPVQAPLWNTAYGWGDHDGLYAPIAGINYANWDTAFGWGNHASGGYADGTNEADWDTAFGWGDHASEGYADGTNEADWDTAFGWGDHASEGYAPTASPTLTGDVTVNDLYPGNQTVGYMREVTGNFGSVEVTGADGSSGTWSGYSIGGEVVFMSNLTGVASSNRSGIYDDLSNAWIINFNATGLGARDIRLFNAGVEVAKTVTRASGGLHVYNDSAYERVLIVSDLNSYLSHADSAFTSPEITVSTSAPSGGSNGDIWLEY